MNGYSTCYIRKILVFPVKHFDYTFKYEFIIKKKLKITKKPVEISMVCTFISSRRREY